MAISFQRSALSFFNNAVNDFLISTIFLENSKKEFSLIKLNSLQKRMRYSTSLAEPKAI